MEDKCESVSAPNCYPEKLTPFRINQLREEFSKRYKPNDDAIVLIWIGKTQRKVMSMHKDLLAVSSSVFRELLKPNATGRIVSLRLEIEPDVFMLIKHFLYFNVFGQDVEVDAAIKILEFSLQFQINSVLTAAKQLLLAKMTPERAFQVLEISRVWKIEELGNLALKIIARNAGQLLMSEEFMKLGSFEVNRILSSDELECDEEVVFNSASSWAQYGVRKKTAAYYFSQVAKCIRFPLMKPAKLAQLTLKTNLLNPAETAKIMQYLCLPESINKDAIELDYNSHPRKKNLVATRTGEEIEKQHVSSSSTSMATLPTSTGSPNTKRRRISTTGSKDTSQDFSIKVFGDTKAKSFEDLFVNTEKNFETDGNYVLGFHVKGATLEQNYNVKELKNVTSLIVDAKLNFLNRVEEDPTKLQDFVSKFDPLRYIVVTRDHAMKLSTQNIWSMGINIMLKFNGVTFLNVQHAQDNRMDSLVLNYLPQSQEILANTELSPTELAISNCEFSFKSLDEGRRATKIENLVLYRVWGDFNLKEILQKCPNLAELRLWKHLPTRWCNQPKNVIAPLTLNFEVKFDSMNVLKELALYKTQLRFTSECHNILPALEDLYLDDCVGVLPEHGNVNEIFARLFPKLKKLGIREHATKRNQKDHVSLATSEILQSVIKKIPTIQWIRVVGMKWNCYTAGERVDANEEGITNFIREVSGSEECPDNFLIERTPGEEWKFTALNYALLEEQDDNVEYESYKLENFFDSCKYYKDYFLMDENFPRSHLSY